MAHNHQVTGSNPVVRNQICSLEFEHATDLTVNQRLAEIVTQTGSQNLVPWRSGSATLLQREGHWFNPNRNYQMSIIYVITNRVNNKQYVGKTEFELQTRFEQHKRDSTKERCKYRPLYRAINKYGIENFSISELENCSQEESCEKEIYWVSKLGTYGKGGYNATPGGDGRPWVDVGLLEFLEASGLTRSEMQEFTGHDFATLRNKLGRVIKKAVKSCKSVMNIDTGEVFESLSEAARSVKSTRQACASHISDAAKGRRKSAYGFKWKFVD